MLPVVAGPGLKTNVWGDWRSEQCREPLQCHCILQLQNSILSSVCLTHPFILLLDKSSPCTQTGLQLTIPLPQPPEKWAYRPVSNVQYILFKFMEYSPRSTQTNHKMNLNKFQRIPMCSKGPNPRECVKVSNKQFGKTPDVWILKLYMITFRLKKKSSGKQENILSWWNIRRNLQQINIFVCSAQRSEVSLCS